MKPLVQPVFLLLSSWLLVMGLAAQPLNAQSVVTISPGEDRFSLRDKLAYFIDSTRFRTWADINRPAIQRAFQPVTTPVPNFGYITGLKAARPVWLRFNALNSTNQDQKLLTEIDFWCFDELQLFVVDDQQRVLSVSPVIGWKTPVEQRVK